MGRIDETVSGVMSRRFDKDELEDLEEDSAKITANYVMLIAASIKCAGIPKPIAERLLREIIEAGMTARNNIKNHLNGMTNDGCEYRIDDDD